jgi:hypothetical protein
MMAAGDISREAQGERVEWIWKSAANFMAVIYIKRINGACQSLAEYLFSFSKHMTRSPFRRGRNPNYSVVTGRDLSLQHHVFAKLNSYFAKSFGNQ